MVLQALDTDEFHFVLEPAFGIYMYLVMLVTTTWLQPNHSAHKKQLNEVYRLVLNSPYIFPSAYGETVTMMTPYGVIGWEKVKFRHTVRVL